LDERHSALHERLPEDLHPTAVVVQTPVIECLKWLASLSVFFRKQD
jgi:hypothetical protein